jgi:hypothetical protein
MIKNGRRNRKRGRQRRETQMRMKERREQKLDKDGEEGSKKAEERPHPLRENLLQRRISTVTPMNTAEKTGNRPPPPPRVTKSQPRGNTVIEMGSILRPWGPCS